MNSPQAIISYDRLHGGVTRAMGSSFNLTALKRALDKAGVKTMLFHMTAIPDAARLKVLAQRLDFTIVPDQLGSASFFETALEAALLQNRDHDPRPIFVFGAKASEATLLHGLRDAGNIVTAFHWITEFDVAIIEAVHSCHVLNRHLLLNLRERRLADFSQAN